MILFTLNMICCLAVGVAVGQFLFWAGFRMREFRFWFFAVVLDVLFTSLVNRMFR